MQLIILPFNISSNDINTSLQVGDDIYFVQTSIVIDNSFLEDNNNLKYLGVCTAINETSITVLTSTPSIDWPQNEDYIMFQKHRSPGVSGVLGYYAEMEFRNNSTKKAELFAVGSEIFESSK